MNVSVPGRLVGNRETRNEEIEINLCYFRGPPYSSNVPIVDMETTDKLPKDRETPLVLYCMGKPIPKGSQGLRSKEATRMNDYVSKPIKREIVFEILEKWVFEMRVSSNGVFLLFETFVL